MEELFIFNIHYNKEKFEISHNFEDSIEIPFKKFAEKQNKKLEDFEFYFKASSINNKFANLKEINSNLFLDNNNNKIYDILAISIEQKEEKKKEEGEKNIENQIKEIPNASVNKKQNDEKKTKYIDLKNIKRNIFYDVICPECETSAVIDIKEEENDNLPDIKLNIKNCDNFHYLKNIKFNYYTNFDDKCNICHVRKIQLTPPENKLYLCSCGIILCPECKEKHNDQGHNKINFEDKNYYCINHNDTFSSYCVDCNANICYCCKYSHINHECFELRALKPRLEDIKIFEENVEKQKTNLKNFIDAYKALFDDMVDTVESYLNSYILIEETLLSRYKNGFMNFQLLRNLRNKKIFNFSLFKKIEEKLNKARDTWLKINIINDIYTSIKFNEIEENFKAEQKAIENPGYNKIELNYRIDDVKSINKFIKLFDPVFVKNNKDKLSIEINGEKQKELSVYYENKKGEQVINVILTEDKNYAVTDMSYMINNCKNLVLVDFSRFDTKNITSTEAMFQICTLQDIPGIISKLSFPNLTNVRAMFCKCLNIKTIPDLCNIFNKTNKIRDISMLFNGCINLKEVINFNKWYLPNITDMSYLFNRCKEIGTIVFTKNISENIRNMCGLFNCCEKLETITQIPLKTKNTEDMSIMFQGCEKLVKIDGIADFYTQNVRDMSGMFSKCHNLKIIPKIGYWKLNNVKEIIGLFNECQSLEKIPDLGSWNMSQIKDASGMFYKCSGLKEAKGINKWRFSNGTTIDNIFDQCSLPNIDDIKKAWKEKK